MRHALRLHPDSVCSAATKIDVDVARSRAGSLVFSFFVTGRIGDLRLPRVTASGRADGLWQHTCFEAFLRAAPGEAYYEFNFAPSTQWAAYRFDSYRSGMRVADEIGPPRIEAQSASECYTLQAALDFDTGAAAWRLGLAAVLEETNGRKSYWALAHPPGRADFHHADCFAYQLPPALRP